VSSTTNTKLNKVYLGLGSNLCDPAKQIYAAYDLISQVVDTCIIAKSGLYTSPPMGPPDQPDYVNAVVAITTNLSPHRLMKKLQAIEDQQGRTRDGIRWGSRIVDLDILLYGEQEIATADLTIPHAGLSERAFVLYPLQEIAPELNIPGKGKLSALVKQCPRENLKLIV